MIVNPYRDRHLLTTLPGTRILSSDFGLIGRRIEDPHQRGRVWRLDAVYAPRSLGGLRVKATDQKEFVSFVSQMDLEVLLGIGLPGRQCYWSGRKYVGADDREFFGFCLDDDDLEDDLFDRELFHRAQRPGPLPQGSEIVRRVHTEPGLDWEELHILLWDGDPFTGMSPDPRFETIGHRWKQVERTRCPWDSV